MVLNLSKILQQKADVLQSLRDRTKVAIGSTPGAGEERVDKRFKQNPQ
jgi:hypothetical protein